MKPEKTAVVTKIKLICAALAVLMLFPLLTACMTDGTDGLSAYEIAVKNGLTSAKSEAEWLASLKGADGKDGVNGRSAYELACEAGYTGSVDEWLLTLKGADGKNGTNGTDGKSAYEIAKATGYTGTEAQWVAELLGNRTESGTGSGVGISSVYVNTDKHLIVRLTNGTSVDAGYVGVSSSQSGTQPGSDPNIGTVDSDGYTVVNQTVTVIAGALNIRSSPDVTSTANIVVYLPMNTELNRVGIGTGDNTWSKVMYNGKVCYASSKYLEVVAGSSSSVDLTGVDIPKVNLLDSYTLLVGKKMCFEKDQFIVGLTSDMSIAFSYSGSGAKTVTADSIAITPSAEETATLTVTIKKYIKGTLSVIYSKTVSLKSVRPSAISVTGLVIGDSRIADGTLVDTLKTNLGSSLSLIGTLRTSNGNAHEGRSSWSTSNYLSYATAVSQNNPFYNTVKGKFDFDHYLRSTGFAAPDFVLFNLGANDGYTSLSVLNFKELISSIQAYGTANGKSIKILIMTEYLAPADGFAVSYAFDAAARREEQFEYFTKLNTAFGSRTAEGIYLIPNYIVVNDTDDRITADATGKLISDVIHLSKPGYRKEADVISAYVYSIFSVK